MRLYRFVFLSISLELICTVAEEAPAKSKTQTMVQQLSANLKAAMAKSCSTIIDAERYKRAIIVVSAAHDVVEQEPRAWPR